MYRQEWESEYLGLTQVTVGEGENEQTLIVFRPFGDAWDENGNKSTIFEVIPDELRSMFFPDVMQDGNAGIQFSKNGFNMIAQGSPGFGPLVTVPAREIIYENPELEETLKFMFPFGHPHGDFFERTRRALAPSWANNLEMVFRNTHTRETVVNRMFRDEVIRRTEVGDPLDWADKLDVLEVLETAEKQTQIFFMFRTFAGGFFPTSAIPQSPYAPLENKYREMERDFGWEKAQTLFLDEYGSDLFALTARMSVLNDGVAASLESETLYEENQDLIKAHPEIGAWISGSVGPQDQLMTFSQANYNRQFNEPLGPGLENRREIKDPISYVRDTEIQLGWRAYSELMNGVRHMQDKAAAAGLRTDLNSSHMTRVANAKQAGIAVISSKYPAWKTEFDDYGSSNARLLSVFAGFSDALKVPHLLERPSTEHIVEFLNLRFAVQDALLERESRGGSANIQNKSNSDLLMIWLEHSEEIGSRPDMEAVYDRFFSRDKLLTLTFLDREDFPILDSFVRYA